MEYARLETAALTYVDDSYYYGAYCRKCKYSARLSLVKLRAHLGENFPLAKVMYRLRCERCGLRGGHHVPGVESANRQCRISLSRGALWSDPYLVRRARYPHCCGEICRRWWAHGEEAGSQSTI